MNMRLMIYAIIVSDISINNILIVEIKPSMINSTKKNLILEAPMHRRVALVQDIYLFNTKQRFSYIHKNKLFLNF